MCAALKLYVRPSPLSPPSRSRTVRSAADDNDATVHVTGLTGTDSDTASPAGTAPTANAASVPRARCWLDSMHSGVN